jgi:hypothetical protein
MKVLVCGSREWDDYEAVAIQLGRFPEGTDVIHGNARGADRIAAKIAVHLGHRVRAVPANWQTEGKRAGILRKLRLLDEQPDLVIAFQVNGSRGTQHTIDEARKRGIPVEVHSPTRLPVGD